MKRCPSCERTYEDSQRFCLQDGTPLVNEVPGSFEQTIIMFPQQPEGEGESPVGDSTAILPPLPATPEKKQPEQHSAPPPRESVAPPPPPQRESTPPPMQREGMTPPPPQRDSAPPPPPPPRAEPRPEQRFEPPRTEPRREPEPPKQHRPETGAPRPPGAPPQAFIPPPPGAAPPPPPRHAAAAPPPVAPKRKIWPWVLGGVGVLGLGFLILLALVVWYVMSSADSSNTGNANTVNVSSLSNNSQRVNTNSVVNANASRSTNSGTSGGATGATEQSAVLAELIKLENEWIRANIKADRATLERILADDYTGKAGDGTTTDKKQYLANLQPDKTAVSWSSEDVKLSLNGDNAVLTGVLIWKNKSGTQRYRFTDTFIKRDGRWQALSSQATPV